MGCPSSPKTNFFYVQTKLGTPEATYQQKMTRDRERLKKENNYHISTLALRIFLRTYPFATQPLECIYWTLGAWDTDIYNKLKFPLFSRNRSYDV